MIVLGPLFVVVDMALNLYFMVIIVSAILSWLIAFNILNTSNQVVYTIVDFLYRITEPALRPIRRIIPNLGGIDISPIILLLGIYFIQGVLRNIHLSLITG